MNMTVICQYRCLYVLNLLPKIKKNNRKQINYAEFNNVV